MKIEYIFNFYKILKKEERRSQKFNNEVGMKNYTGVFPI